MKQSYWNCKYCINDYFATGTLDCERQDDMTEEFEDYYSNNDGENCTYYKEDTRS